VCSIIEISPLREGSPDDRSPPRLELMPWSIFGEKLVLRAARISTAIDPEPSSVTVGCRELKNVGIVRILRYFLHRGRSATLAADRRGPVMPWSGYGRHPARAAASGHKLEASAPPVRPNGSINARADRGQTPKDRRCRNDCPEPVARLPCIYLDFRPILYSSWVCDAFR
jgi:hypothetical protein